MVDLAPVSARLVNGLHARAVVGPAYDSLSPQERLALVEGSADSIFGVIHDPRDADGGPDDADGGPVYAAGAARLARLLATDRYGPLRSPSVYLYQIEEDGRRQLGVVGDVRLAQVSEGVIRPHERTRPAREAQLAGQLRALRINTSPVGLAYRADARIDELVEAWARATPELDFVTVDGVRNTVWTASARLGTDLVRAFAAVARAYIIDGHHRVAASQAVGDSRVLAAFFPHDQVTVRPYHRVVARRDLTGPQLEAALSTLGILEPLVPSTGREAEAGELIVYHRGRWWRLKAPWPPGDLGVSFVDERVLREVLGVEDARTDPSIRFVPGGLPLARLVAAADDLGGVALLVAPPTVEEMLAAADAGRDLPPKSTWFVPKPRPGIFLAPRGVATGEASSACDAG